MKTYGLLIQLGRGAGLFALALGLSGLYACAPLAMATPSAVAPQETEKPGVSVPTQDAGSIPLATPTGATPNTRPAPAIHERRLLELEFPPVIKQNDGATIRLTLRLDEAGNLTPIATSAGGEVIGTPVMIPNLYDTHRVIAQARLDVVGLEAAPAIGSMQMQTLFPGQEISFYWSIRSTEVGNFSGVVWFGLRFEPLDGSLAIEDTISAQPLEIACVNFLGVGGAPARLMGSAGALLSALFGKDEIVEFIKKLASRRKPPSKPSTHVSRQPPSSGKTGDPNSD